MSEQITHDQAQSGAKEQIARLRQAIADFQAARTATDQAALGVVQSKLGVSAAQAADMIGRMRDTDSMKSTVEDYFDFLTILTGKEPSEAELSVGPHEVVVSGEYTIPGSPEFVSGLGFEAWKLTNQYAALRQTEEAIQRELGIPGVRPPSRTGKVVGVVTSLLLLAAAGWGCFTYGKRRALRGEDEDDEDDEDDDEETLSPGLPPIASSAPAAPPIEPSETIDDGGGGEEDS